MENDLKLITLIILIGYEFVKKYFFSFNLKKKKVYNEVNF